MKLKSLSLLLMLGTVPKMYSQEPTFVQFNSVPLYYNPGYAGSAGSPRLAFSYKNDSYNWGQLSYLSYDQVVKKLHGALGLVVYDNYNKLSDYRSNRFFSPEYSNTMYCGLAYAAKFNLFNKVSLSPAIKIGYIRQDVKSEYYRYSLYVDDKRVYTLHEFDLSLGAVINTEKLHFGFAADHLNKPFTNSFSGIGSSRKYTTQFGYTFQRKGSSAFSVTPGFLYVRQGASSNLMINLSARYKWLALGAGFGSQLNGMVGYCGKKMMIGYSFGWRTTRIKGFDTPVTHELSVRHIFAVPDVKAADQKPVKRQRIFRNRKRILQN